MPDDYNRITNTQSRNIYCLVDYNHITWHHIHVIYGAEA